MAARILVVEDNPANLKLMTYLLQAFGHTVLAALDGDEAVEIVRKEVLDLIVCDVHLPKMDGYEVARQLKQHPTFRAIPLVAVTALAMVGDRDKVLAAGFDGYISKPIVPQTFVRELEAFLPAGAGRAPKPQELLTALEACWSAKNGPPPSPSKATILVVDDDPDNRKLASYILEPAGYHVLTVRSVADALALARRRVPDLILSDIRLTCETGFDLLAACQADRPLQRVPFILVSAIACTEDERARGMALGATRIVERPSNVQSLLDLLEECLRQPRGQ